MRLKPRTTLERQDTLEGDNLFFYNFASKFVKHKSVLDIGTGYGFGANYLKKKGAKSVKGIDIDKEAINFAKKKFTTPYITFSSGDVTTYKFQKEKYDVVIAFDVIEHLPLKKHEVFLKKMKDVINHNGILIVGTPNKLFFSPNKKTPNNPYHVKEYLPEELKEIVLRFFPKTELLGVKITNVKFNREVNKLNKQFRYKIFNYFGTFKLARDLMSFVPKKLRRNISGEAGIPKREISDFKIIKNKINGSRNLLTISVKK